MYSSNIGINHAPVIILQLKCYVIRNNFVYLLQFIVLAQKKLNSEVLTKAN